MFKKLLIGLLVLGVIAAGAGYYLFSNLDSYVKAAIEKYGTQATGTQVTVGSVNISTTSGEGTLSNLVITNPKGYSQPDAFDLGTISVTIDTHSLLGDGPVIIHEIDIKGPVIDFEVDNSGNNNLKAIQKNAQNYSAPATTPTNPNATSESSPKDAKPARKFIISDLYIHDGQVKLSHAMLDGKVITSPMPTIHLTNIGKDSGGVSPAQVAKQLIAAVSAASIQDASQQLGKQISAQMKDAMKNGSAGAGNVGNSLKGLIR
jgi:uncharacterized protein involved in outer membrane biogenesis